jgi:hypothetical protein
MTRQICFIHVVKVSKIRLIVKKEKQSFCWKKDWKYRGETANLSTLGLLQASTSITPSLALLLTARMMPCLYTILVMSLISKRKRKTPSVIEIFVLSKRIGF